MKQVKILKNQIIESRRDEIASDAAILDIANDDCSNSYAANLATAIATFFPSIYQKFFLVSLREIIIRYST